MPAATETRTEKGISLARGPALILGTVLLAATFEPVGRSRSGRAQIGPTRRRGTETALHGDRSVEGRAEGARRIPGAWTSARPE